MGKRKESRKNSKRFNKRMANSNVISMSNHDNTPQRHRKKKVQVLPRSLNQEEYLFAIEDNTITFGVGPAGTGKTLLATTMAIKELRNGNIDRIIITRPAITTGEELGHLPGTLYEKMLPFIRPILDIFEEYYSPAQIEKMIEDGVLEISPLAFMRGRTFKNAWVIADEMQNSTPSTLKMCLTRIGENSKMVVTGDLRQHDHGNNINGLKDFIQREAECKTNNIKIIHFENNDIERHQIITDVLSLYGE